ncbi:OmpA family protein [Flavobacterium silvisoli]|uniref:OmpA family protein n=1 Tax=Flavobacterium silvisoli TaxID=2529433 RepID=A0A4Q9YU36_9FLAO|nr:OmpA family protein [Flavobacterium silvisoli]TBX66980.1 OmpA family protein [Flavobacterium silvisoli]
MKKHLLLVITLLSASVVLTAQEKKNEKKADKEFISADVDKEIQGDTYNRWSIEVDFGQSKGGKPYADGYFASDPDKFMGGFQFNHYGIGARYMLSPKFGLKSHLSYDDIKKLPGSRSLDFKVQHIQLTFEGVVNAARLFDIQEGAKRFGMLFHFGIQASQMMPKMNTAAGSNKGRKELNGGIVVGITPSYRIFNNVSVFTDITINSNVRQHFNWDGSYSDRSNNLTGSLFTTSLGLSFALGKGKVHGDWAIIKDKKDKEIDELSNRIGEIETLMNDSDKDGVPDYLDAENNSIAGVAVDTKGRMVDKNNNGVPDELEKYIDKTITNNNNNNTNTATVTNGMLEQLINDGYVAAYFDANKTKPTNASADNIGFVLNYLKNNPDKSVQIIGYADELGSSDYNNKLSGERAQNVKTILTKAGISPSRLTIVGNGIDSSVDKNSEYARRLVRKVIFKIK